MTIPPDHEDEAALRDQNYRFFRDCISTTLVRSTPGTLAEGRRKKQHPSSSSRSSRRRQQQQQQDEDEAKRKQGHYPSAASQQARHARDVEELADFAEYLSAEIFASLPPVLQLLTYRTWREAPESLQSQFSLPITADAISSAIDLPDAVGESLATYGLVAPDLDNLSSPSSSSSLPPSPEAFLIPALTDYITPLTKPPPCSPRSKVTECELCEREWAPLTYHHLIPRFVHDKAVKRGWHRKEDLQNVAWLCRTCHTYIHHVKTHEELARYFYTVDRLLEDEAIFKYAAWISKLT
ncbi:hypothetical protein N3K66_003016 [Trichothecium roseum]|uniref:Uncharacterized protein n=1 Tax=Trichothecium roseum TaxID=47278 RepID=A0ACC0V5U1_9HYPO|nr:hypothetical protein N3K66_003016 [Trichothecium roseum]